MAAKALDACIKTLRTSKSDTELFAALLLVTKIVKSGECEREKKKEIYEAIGFCLPKRLLKTGGMLDGCPSFEFRKLSIILLHCFCSEKDLVTAPGMLGCLDQMNGIVNYEIDTSLDEKDIDSQKSMMTECFECLKCIAGHTEGRQALIEHETVTALCLACCKSTFGSDLAQELLNYLIVSEGENMWGKNLQGLQDLIISLTNRFSEVEGEGKFLICDQLRILLQSVSKDQIRKLEINEWSSRIRATLFHILCNKLGQKHRNSAIKLASKLTERLGIPWALGPNEESHRFLLLLVHLACIEVRMVLEAELDLDKICSNDTSDLLSSCYIMLEIIISYMTSGPSLLLDAKQVKQLHSAMVGAFNADIHFLSEVAIHHPEQSQNPVVLASIRVLGAWMAEETTALQAEILQLLPFLIKVCKESIELLGQIETQSSKAECDCCPPRDSVNQITMELSSTKLNSFTNDEKVSKIGKCVYEPSLVLMEKKICKYHLFKVDVLRFLLAGFCHLTADEHASSILKKLQLHELLGKYFTLLWEELQGDSQSEATRVSLATICGIFLNMIVLGKDSVSSQKVFTELLLFIITRLPGLVQLKGHLVLNFNLAVVGLMLLRYHGSTSDLPQVGCNNFFWAVIFLFRHAHNIQKSEEGIVALEISDQYKADWNEISELWFLGLQALCECVRKFPSLTNCLLASDWIADLLRELEIIFSGPLMEGEIVASYIQILSALAGSSSKARQAILDKGGLQFARSYKMHDLELILSRR